MSKQVVHKECGSEVTFDRDYISEGDPDMQVEGVEYYYAACLSCDEDLFVFETKEVDILE